MQSRYSRVIYVTFNAPIQLLVSRTSSHNTLLDDMNGAGRMFASWTTERRS